ncbi:hypothetical protein E2562_020340, partial [Oryza meyeriana var. granulata]
GCEGSVLINSTKTNKAEKDAKPNRTLDAFDVIDAIKEKLESKCPAVVSCADILAIAARDALSLATKAVRQGRWSKDGNLYEVETGRRDGRVSSAKEAVTYLPDSFDGIRKLITRFASKGLSLKDLAVLSGAHALDGRGPRAGGRRRLSGQRGEVAGLLCAGFDLRLSLTASDPADLRLSLATAAPALPLVPAVASLTVLLILWTAAASPSSRHLNLRLGFVGASSERAGDGRRRRGRRRRSPSTRRQGSTRSGRRGGVPLGRAVRSHRSQPAAPVRPLLPPPPPPRTPWEPPSPR